MRALAVVPGKKDSAQLLDVPEPNKRGLLVEMVAIGICGTDREILAGLYGMAPPHENYLILGHESLGQIVSAPAGSGFAEGDLVVGFVRRPDPVPCPNCAVEEWDMCRNGRYTEHGIKELHGFCSEWYQLDPHFTVKVNPRLGELGVLVEPASVVAKAWDHILKIGSRARFLPRNVLITGAGPIGLLAALMARQHGFEVDVVDRVADGPKPALVKALGGTYYTSVEQVGTKHFDVGIECTGVGVLFLEMLKKAGPDSVVCLTGLSSGKRKIEVNLSDINRDIVLENGAVFGSVNANRRHYELAVRSLEEADPNWLASLITDRVPLSRWRDVLTPRPSTVKMIIVPDHAAKGGSWQRASKTTH